MVEILEILSGLALFCEGVPEDKVRCNSHLVLFDLFDFNMHGIISRTDLQLMLHLTLCSVAKILGIYDEIGTREVV